MRYYTYGGRSFASIAAAKAFHDMRNYFSDDKWIGQFQPQKWHVTPSRTLTKEKQKSKMEDNVQGLKHRYVHISTGLPKLKGMLKGSIQYRDQDTQSVGTNGNRQTNQVISYIGASAQWLSSSTNVVTNRDSQSYTPWINLSPTGGLAASSVVTATATVAADKMGLSYATVYQDIVNRTTAPAFLKVTYVCAVQDTDEDPLETYNQGTTANALYNSSYGTGAAGTVPTGSGNEVVSLTLATSTSQSFMLTVPYTNLQNRRNFKSIWRTLKTVKMTLAAADTARITAQIKMNQFCIKERMSYSSVLFPKGCVAIIFSVQGAAAVDTASQSTIIGAPTIGVVTTRKIQLCPMKVPNTRFEPTYVGAGTVPTLTTNVNTEQISEALANAAVIVT